jgi:hypothetical protein
VTLARVTRRRWLLGALGSAGLGWAGVYHVRRLRHPDPGDLATFIRARLSHLNLDAAAPDQFAAEYSRRFGSLVMSRHHALTFGGLLGANALRRFSAGRAADAVRLERRLVGDFLLSTTYFREPPGTPVRYLRYADPYEGPCTNPFADLSMP